MLRQLAERKLVISPLLAADQVGGSSIDLRMGTVVLMARAGSRSHVDPAAYKTPNEYEGIESRKQKHERFDVPYLHSFLLHPGSLALVPTLEWVKLPRHLQGIVTARSSWAREGLNIATATAGFRKQSSKSIAWHVAPPRQITPERYSYSRAWLCSI